MTAERVFIADADYPDLDRVVGRMIADLKLDDLIHGTRGKKVWLKPNLLGLYTPEKHATTHPALVTAMLKVFRQAGAEVLVGDNPGVGGYGLNEKVARKSGILAAADGSYRNAGATAKEIPVRSRFFDKMVVSAEMLEADLIVNLPKLKTHSLTVVTGAVKNMFGLLIGGCKGQTHAQAPRIEEFGEALADLYAIRIPELNVFDAVYGMEGNGPTAGKVRRVGKLIASTNAVAADLVACRLMGADPARIIHLAVAAERGLGPKTLNEVEVLGRVETAAPRFKLPVTVSRYGFLGRWFNDYFYHALLRPTLALNREKCSQCKICVEQCPTGAMKLEQYPRIEESECIRCFCCHELCPESAWEFRGLMRRVSARTF